LMRERSKFEKRFTWIQEKLSCRIADIVYKRFCHSYDKSRQIFWQFCTRNRCSYPPNTSSAASPDKATGNFFFEQSRLKKGRDQRAISNGSSILDIKCWIRFSSISRYSIWCWVAILPRHLRGERTFIIGFFLETDWKSFEPFLFFRSNWRYKRWI